LICDDAAVNFLAYLVLAGLGPKSAASAGSTIALAGTASLVGSLLPDLTRSEPNYRGRKAERHPDLPTETRLAIVVHRRIDRITDTHPAFLRTRARLLPRYGRFAGVLADVLMDHALSTCWDRAPEVARHPLPELILPEKARADFILGVHTRLASSEARRLMPPSMAETVAWMLRHRWLDRYATAAGLERTGLELSYRFTRGYGRRVDLGGVADHLQDHGNALLVDFAALWPDLCRRAGGPAGSS
jgi:acyl carrier protein phosphodiesterase